MTDQQPVRQSSGFVPPIYPFDRLGDLATIAAAHEGGAVDLSVGTPCDPPSRAVVEALASSDTERGYPTSVGSVELREAAAQWMLRRLGVEVEPGAIAACVGTKELVASVPALLHLRDPSRDTVLYPELSYPTYEMGAILARCRAVPVGRNPDGTLDLTTVSTSDADRALCLWVNSPGNPTGVLDDLGAAASWGRARGVPVFSDECYVEFTWADRPRTILEHGSSGVVAVHSLSKRSNLAGLRAGFYAGDSGLVRYLSEVRRHAGLMQPGPVQRAAAVALFDDAEVDHQRGVYHRRLQRFAQALSDAGVPAQVPGGSFYLWVAAPPGLLAPGLLGPGLPEPEDGAGPPGPPEPGDDGGGWRLARCLARRAGLLVSPGDTYGPAGRDFVRVAMVQPDERLALVQTRLSRTRVESGESPDLRAEHLSDAPGSAG